MRAFMQSLDVVRQAKLLVVKVGTSVLRDSGSVVSRDRVEAVASEIAAVRRAGKKIVLVTSGAIGTGMDVMGMKKRPTELSRLQAAAAIGQGRLIQWYTARFEQEGFHAAQILLTREDIEDRRRSMNAKGTLLTLLENGVVPIVNENDTVSVEEIRYGDNDVLSAHVSVLIGADLLVILSDVDSFSGPETPVRVITEVTSELEKCARGSAHETSTGGMKTKFDAAKEVMKSGIPMVFMDGRGRESLTRLVVRAEERGTWFIPKHKLRS